MNNKKAIAILRGGKDDYHRSVRNGANIIIPLGKYQDLINVVDVIIDESGNWFEKGVPSDPHKVFSRVDYYIDFTNNKDAEYHNLSRKLYVKKIFNNSIMHSLDRVNIKRILSQINIDMPKYIFIRDSKNIENTLKNIWNKFHTPLVIKESNHHFNKKSLITYSFLDSFNKIKEIINRGGEALIEEHVHGKYISVAVIPDYRGQDIYIPTPAEIVNTDAKRRILQDKILIDKHLIDHNHVKKNLIHLDDDLKIKIKKLIEDIYKVLMLDHHTLIDLVILEKHNKENKSIDYIIKVLDLHIAPQIFEDSRFDFILKNSGVDMGKFILDRIEKLEESEKAY